MDDNEPKAVKLRVSVPEAPTAPRTAPQPAQTLVTPDATAARGGAGPTLRKADLIERAMARTEVKKADAKPAMDALLVALAEALGEGAEIQLPPLGKLKVVKSRDIGDGAQVLTLKLRTAKDGQGGA